LYGANVFNGILFMTSKSPLQVKELSLLNLKKAAGNDYVDYGTVWQKHLVQN
jgi:hypothetical protein